MITDIEGFDSINSLSSLPDGLYSIKETLYESEAGHDTATLKELIPGNGSDSTACDLICVTSNGAILFRDFMKLPNGDWRDSYGRCADLLDGLLPNELAAYRMVHQLHRSAEVRGGALIDGLSLANGAGQ